MNNSVLNKIKLTETTKLNKYRDTELRVLGHSPPVFCTLETAVQQLLTDTLKGPHKEVPWAASSPRAEA
jgi:hypothetical protein